MNPPLKFEQHPSYNLYECQHITAGTHGLQTVLPVGPTANILLCKHCWQHTIGLVSEELLETMLQQAYRDTLKQLLNSPSGGAETADPSSDVANSSTP